MKDMGLLIGLIGAGLHARITQRADPSLLLPQQKAPLPAPAADKRVRYAVSVEIAYGDVPATGYRGLGDQLIGYVREVPVTVIAVSANSIWAETRNIHSAHQQIGVPVMVEVDPRRCPA